ncbi:MAG: hypothetical protein A2418_01300 [Candidatus Brennerbacteria bacterium RIFOXYC1_FULL_41_11]|uniref:Type II secretion system protein GspH n=1 Tax=Candidatus Brennerbacteria bacterium RIFOXYD1_FULL_41_16 TaxID=1797529 RepID=A0A1G1XKK6_9BACT|nr:MAG: hypothetical protein A2391_00070 [Candidatus Brennerbacteria bacterium RIFOXYB1_FULL_41_13]OGY39210.1 MAG: hypothetical protein A2418_01300 [Candidatus Brennerbacteria bacterium RIFOXYC1_FULL_41_11]OGY40492.1 MAG: hypothetical protein A2570_01960 [Candidatus Brennerbacteria bacterium RIFOXYD1_FULL_41_16]
MRKNLKGFTLIELLIVIGIMVVLAGVVIVALNPARQFALARNSQRWSNVNAILNAVGQRMAENRGVWDTDCNGTVVNLPTATSQIGLTSGTNLQPCLVADYIASMVMDPEVTSLDATGYVIVSSGTRIFISAPGAELGETIEVSR